MSTSSDIKYRPLGFRSASTGTRLPMRVKSSSVELHAARLRHGEQVQHRVGRAAERDVTVIAFSNASCVRMSHGLMPALDQAAPRPRRRCEASLRLVRDDRLLRRAVGRLMPSASMAQAMVFAVYMPPQQPGPGIAVLSTSCSSLSVIVPLRVRPDGLEDRDDVAVLVAPGGWCRHRRTRRAVQPRHGHHAARHVLVAAADGHEAVQALRRPTTVSMESAMTSRDTSEYLMPGVPIEMPSETVMVLKTIALAAGGVRACRRFASPARRCACCTA